MALNTDRHLNKEERLERLHAKVAAEPTITDDELAKEMGVSIHTIRADRLPRLFDVRRGRTVAGRTEPLCGDRGASLDARLHAGSAA